MNVYWTVFFVVLLVGFIVGETYALRNDKPTLSRFVWSLSKAWPPLPFFVGFAVGFLACHFWWGGIVYFAPVQ